MSAYHDGARRLQDRFDSRRLADSLAEKLSRTAFTAEDKAFVEASGLFFLATADAEGQPDCSYKGGVPGFVRVTGPSELSFPSYDGNGMFRSLGNVLVNPRVGILFIDFEKPRRLRVLGRARLEDPDGSFEGAQLVVRVHAEAIFPNCPRYIHRMQPVETSVYAPRPGHEPPEPRWKQSFKDVLPGRK
ncbi:MAG TPA: pyridoxamine 5'-phosphate oxidase family protein [Burkholderiales bacterium]|nr:pyridoxamine 5'-phosphate oxidase family protein [Burkholderiales bacterium]